MTKILFKLGDNVISKIHGNGIVIGIGDDYYSIAVDFHHTIEYFSLDGKYDIEDSNPILILKEKERVRNENEIF